MSNIDDKAGPLIETNERVEEDKIEFDVVDDAVPGPSHVEEIANFIAEVKQKRISTLPQAGLNGFHNFKFYPSLILDVLEDIQSGELRDRVDDLLEGESECRHPYTLVEDKDLAYPKIKDRFRKILGGGYVKPSEVGGAPSNGPSTSDASTNESILPTNKNPDNEDEKSIEITEAEKLDSYGLPPLSKNDLKIIARARKLKKECGLLSDLREFVHPAPKPKSIVNFIDSFIKEQQWIGKEQRLLVKVQKKFARRTAIDTAKVAQSKFRSAEDLAKRDEAIVRKGAATIAAMISSYWAKQKMLLDLYEQKLMEEAKSKRLESQLMNVIDRSSTLTQMMLPKLKKVKPVQRRQSKIVSDLLNQPDDMDELLASLPPEYLASLTGGVSVLEEGGAVGEEEEEEESSSESESESEASESESKPSSPKTIPEESELQEVPELPEASETPSKVASPEPSETSLYPSRRRSTRQRSGPFAVNNVETVENNVPKETDEPQSTNHSIVSASPRRSLTPVLKEPVIDEIEIKEDEVKVNGNSITEEKQNSLKRKLNSPSPGPKAAKMPKIDDEKETTTNGITETEMTDDSGRASSPRSIPDATKTDQSADAPIADDEMNDLAKIASSFRPTGSTYDTADVRTPVPTLLEAKLREYQHIGLDWLSSLFENKLNGILADEMGLGKTVQTIAFIAHLAEHKRIWGPHLIVVPTSVLLNWEREFKRFCPYLKILTYFGSMKERAEKRKGWKTPNAFNVCITSYDLYIRDTRMFKWRAWQCLVLDEAHNIKNSKSLRWNKLLSLRTRIRLLLTGTPLQNNLMELWSLLYFLMPSVFASEDDFKNWFNDPMNAMIDGSAEYNVKIVEKLHTVLRPFILRRLKSEVEKQMPLKLERVIHCPLARIQRNMYNQFIRQKSTIDSIRGGSAVSVMNIIMQLRKCCNHPNLFYPIECSAPSALPALRLNYPDAMRDFHSSKIEIEPLFSMLRDDFTDENENLNFLMPKRQFLTKSVKCSYTRSNVPLQLRMMHRKVLTRLRTFHETVPEVVSPKMQWLWRVTKPIRDTLYRRHEIIEGHIFEPLAVTVQILQRKFVRMYSFPTFSVYAPYPKSSTALPITVDEEKACDHVLKEEDELISHVHYTLPIQYPDARLVELDCGKLRMLAKLLRELNAGGHRCLIFTQMSKMLDILEVFLSHQKYPYFRLDGSTPIQQRQVLMDRFNKDTRIFAFILSTRSGGVGMNLTGADSVIFYDSDWNPTMDAQAQDRCHRIGQTRNVLIYRLISSHTIEENILKKATHKRRLGEMTLDEGEFTPKTSENMRELFQGEEALQDVLGDAQLDVGHGDLEKAMYRVEDQDDVKAAQELRKEMGEEKRQTADGFLEELLSELNPIERHSFMFHYAEHSHEIEERLRAVEPEEEPASSDGEALDSDDDEDDKGATPVKVTPPPPPSKPLPKILKVLPRRSSGVASQRKKRVRFN